MGACKKDMDSSITSPKSRNARFNEQERGRTTAEEEKPAQHLLELELDFIDGSDSDEEDKDQKDAEVLPVRERRQVDFYDIERAH